MYIAMQGIQVSPLSHQHSRHRIPMRRETLPAGKELHPPYTLHNIYPQTDMCIFVIYPLSIHFSKPNAYIRMKNTHFIILRNEAKQA